IAVASPATTSIAAPAIARILRLIAVFSFAHILSDALSCSRACADCRQITNHAVTAGTGIRLSNPPKSIGGPVKLVTGAPSPGMLTIHQPFRGDAPGLAAGSDPRSS